MKVKLKDKKMLKKNGLHRDQLKALNRGEVVSIDKVPDEAKGYLVDVTEKSKKGE